jgi:hypothetical protein
MDILMYVVSVKEFYNKNCQRVHLSFLRKTLVYFSQIFWKAYIFFVWESMALIDAGL